jgi:DNA invertase Pin-like site-specific DNA recombinase
MYTTAYREETAMATPKANDPKGRVFNYSRWSSDRQTKGDSLRRQADLALEWCQRNQRVLADEKFIDPGVNAWRGKHRREGRLGDLLKLVRQDDIILVEDHTRWSREVALQSMNTLHDVVNRGVSIIFLATGLVVNSDNFNRPDVFLSNVLNAFMANRENEERGRKIREAMEGKRQALATGKLLFGRLPAWLRWDKPPKQPDRKIIKDPVKVEQVRRIFGFCIAGHGGKAIAKEMAKEPPISTSKRAIWNNEFIVHLLRDRSVMGYHNSGAKVYPQIVPENIYYAAQAKLDERRFSSAVRSENGNIFTGTLRCSACGGSMTRQQCHAPDGRSYTYLICSNHLRGRTECSASGLRYEQLEAAFLELATATGGLRRLLSGPAAPSNVAVEEAKVSDVEKRYKRVLEAIESTDNPDLVQRLNALDIERKKLGAALEAERAKAATSTPPTRALEQVAALAKTLDEPGVRAQVRSNVRGFISSIDVDVSSKPKTATLRFKGTKDWLCLHFVKSGYYTTSRTAERLPENAPAQQPGRQRHHCPVNAKYIKYSR